jgi:hypothetical protein
MREDTHTVCEPEDIVALPPVPDRREENLRLRAIVTLRRRRPDVRDGPREFDAEDLARALRLCAPSAPPLYPTLHGEHATGCMTLRCMMSIRLRPEVRISLARARRGARGVAEEERTGVALTVAHKHGAHRLGGGGHENE